MRENGVNREPSDEVLLTRIIDQDRAAFSELYDRYIQAVYALAAHTLGVSEAEEVVQECFMRLWNHANQFDPARGSFGGWFMTLVRNRVRDSLRKHSRQQQIMVAEEIEQLLLAAADNVEEISFQQARDQALLQALKMLPEEQRRVIILAYFEGMSQSTIAETQAIPLGTVKKRISLGLQKLRRFMQIEDRVEQTDEF